MRGADFCRRNRDGAPNGRPPGGKLTGTPATTFHRMSDPAPALDAVDTVADPQLDFKRATDELVQHQGDTIAMALFIAAVVFAALTLKNVIDGFPVIAAVCGLATFICLIYGRAFKQRAQRPISDQVLAFLTLVILGLVVGERGLTGVLWCYPLILFFYLVADRSLAQLFNACAIVIATAICYRLHDGQVAFRVGATLLIGSAFAIVYTNILRSQQERQEEQRRRLDLLLRCSNPGGYEWDATTGTAAFSPRLKEMLGYAADADTKGWTLENFAYGDDRQKLEHAFARLLQAKGPAGSAQQAKSLDFRMRRADGERVWLHVDAIAIAGANSRTEKLIASFLDITPLMSAEESTRAALQRQQELNELRSRFVAMTSHEFRTPLAAILSSAELLRYYGERLPGTEKTALLGTIDDNVKRMTQMLDQILLISKAEARMLDFQPRAIDLGELCARLLDDVQLRHADAPSRLRLEFTCNANDRRYDDRLLRHIFDNLLSNAIKYSPRGGDIVFRIGCTPEATEFTVSDQGIGIPAQDIPNLFDSFHRASNVGDIKGTGLGLAIVKASVELHGGSIEVASTPGQGTCFTVSIPSRTAAGD